MDHRTNITNVSADIYGGGNKNWGVSNDRNGRIYVANNNGLLEYNGLKWRLYTDAPCAIMRSVLVSREGRIYTGGFREFGYWDRNEAGILHYTSLSDQLDEVRFQDEDIWRIQQSGNEIYFQSFSRIYRYDGVRVEVIDPRQFIMFLQQVGKRLLIESGGELMAVDGLSLTPVGRIGASTVRVILPDETDGLLLGAASGELFRMKEGNAVPWDTEVAKALKGHDLNCGILLKNGRYLFGTLGNGIYETDEKGKILHHYTTENFLQSNSIQAFSEDELGNVWVAMDEGIAKLEFSPKMNFFMDPAHQLGSVYAAATYQGNLYLGTNKGLFYLPESALWQANPFGSLQRVKGSRTQVWSLQVFGNELICGDNKGAFRVENGSADYLYEGSGVLGMSSLGKSDDILLSTYHTPALLTRGREGRYHFGGGLTDFAGVCNTVDVDNLDFVWMGHLYKGLFQNVLSDNGSELKQLRYFPSEEFKEKGMPVKVTRLGHRTLFVNADRFFFYNELEQRIEPFDILNRLKLPVERINKIVAVNDHTYWVMGKNSFAVLDYVNGNVRIDDIGYFDNRRYTTVDDYENMVPLNDTVSLVCLNNGFALYHHQVRNGKPALQQIRVDRAISSGNPGGPRMLPLGADEPVLLNAAANNLTFDIASRNHSEGDNYYSYMLEGIDTIWSEPVRIPSLSYERLPKGKYRFRIRPLNADLDKHPELESVFAFEVLAPWYLSAPAITVWLLLLMLTGYVIYHRMRRRHREELRKQAQKNEEQRVREKNSMLEEMVKHKNNELFQITATMLRKNEMITDIRAEIENFNVKHPDSPIGRKLNRIVRSMTDESVAKEDWSLFIMHFEQTHENFFKNVKEAYPSFTPAELKLCACLKLNLATKDIASLLNISVRGVEAGRYRLRKKIEIDPNESLNEFFIRNF